MADASQYLPENVYGPAAPFSEYHRGQIIRYRENNVIHQGVVLWACAPERIAVGREPLGLRYLVDNPHHQRPDVVFPAQIVAGTVPETMVMRSLRAVQVCQRIGPLMLHLDRESGELHVSPLDTPDGIMLSAQEAEALLAWLTEYREVLRSASREEIGKEQDDAELQGPA